MRISQFFIYTKLDFLAFEARLSFFCLSGNLLRIQLEQIIALFLDKHNQNSQILANAVDKC